MTLDEVRFLKSTVSSMMINTCEIELLSFRHPANSPPDANRFATRMFLLKSSHIIIFFMYVLFTLSEIFYFLEVHCVFRGTDE